MNPITPQQWSATQTWTEQRDKLLGEIGAYTRERDEKREQGVEAGANLAALHVSIAEARGRLAEIDALEARHRSSVASDVAALEVRKTELECECAALAVDAQDARGRHADTVAETETLRGANATMREQASLVEAIVGQIAETSRTQSADAKLAMAEVRTVAAEVIERGNENVRQTGIVLGKLPRYIFELQKPIPLRRTYAMPRGASIPPAEVKKILETE